MRRAVGVGVVGVAAGVAVGALVLAGCFIVTGSTDGYQLQPPPEAGPREAAACTLEAGACLEIGCMSAADCDPDGGSPLCCIAFGVSPLEARFSCAASCLAPAFQSCRTMSTECGDAATCTPHKCTVSGTDVFFNTCGQNPCSLAP
jgi:hypothetical protein